jgi:hypothetical protein
VINEHFKEDFNTVLSSAIIFQQPVIVFVKKPFRYRTVFFYNHLYHPSVCRNVFLKCGIKIVLIRQMKIKVDLLVIEI